jgi:hypothetical protein
MILKEDKPDGAPNTEGYPVEEDKPCHWSARLAVTQTLARTATFGLARLSYHDSG